MNPCRIVVQFLALVAMAAILTTLIVMHPWSGNNNTNATNATVEIYNNPYVPNRRLLINASLPDT